ncbi:hypothetical protein S140_23 [Shewanella sp. phage 1/40]|uniref:hypothetical protein n=1 Tax=Shewanella sp. phage 1/40 TaxID=1458860 RepID=UPI0004F6F7C0|nr:hypothetical protein S140_23 [Shewanella sp. phage 1/40]AHK11433.1 hypothetical protein S140_23 [Shewanella sp. phage 1/40]
MNKFWEIVHALIGIFSLGASIAYEHLNMIPQGNTTNGEQAILCLIMAAYCFIILEINSSKNVNTRGE